MIRVGVIRFIIFFIFSSFISTSINTNTSFHLLTDADHHHHHYQLNHSSASLIQGPLISYRTRRGVGVSSLASSSPDKSISSFITERTCWWNEPCKRQFQRIFRCKCPDWAYCRGPGKYFHAHCSASSTGYIWDQNVASDKEPDAESLLGSKLRRKNSSSASASGNVNETPKGANGRRKDQKYGRRGAKSTSQRLKSGGKGINSGRRYPKENFNVSASDSKDD